MTEEMLKMLSKHVQNDEEARHDATLITQYREK